MSTYRDFLIFILFLIGQPLMGMEIEPGWQLVLLNLTPDTQECQVYLYGAQDTQDDIDQRVILPSGCYWFWKASQGVSEIELTSDGFEIFQMWRSEPIEHFSLLRLIPSDREFRVEDFHYSHPGSFEALLEIQTANHGISFDEFYDE